MLKMKVDEARVMEIVVTGTIPDIVAELLLGVKTIKEKMDESTGMGDAFIGTIKKGLELLEMMDDEDTDVDEKVNELVDKALEDDDFLEVIMEAIPDELKVDFAKRMKERARMGKAEIKTETGAEEK